MNKQLDLKKTEFWVAILGMIGMIATAVLEANIIAESSVVWVVLGILATAGTYIGGRSHVKAAEAKAAPIYKSNESASIRTGQPEIDG